MDTKLPMKFAPYGIQMGESIGDIYCKLGTITDNEEIKQKGFEILASEIVRYSKTYRYLTVLQRKPWQLATISRIDRYAPTYVVSLLTTYTDNGGDVEELLDTLVEQGIDLTHLLEVQAAN